MEGYLSAINAQVIGGYLNRDTQQAVEQTRSESAGLMRTGVYNPKERFSQCPIFRKIFRTHHDLFKMCWICIVTWLKVRPSTSHISPYRPHSQISKAESSQYERDLSNVIQSWDSMIQHLRNQNWTCCCHSVSRCGFRVGRRGSKMGRRGAWPSSVMII